MTPISKVAIREFSGRIIGWLETDKEGNQQVRDFYGKILTKGNTVNGLLYSPQHNPDFKP